MIRGRRRRPWALAQAGAVGGEGERGCALSFPFPCCSSKRTPAAAAAVAAAAPTVKRCEFVGRRGRRSRMTNGLRSARFATPARSRPAGGAEGDESERERGGVGRIRRAKAASLAVARTAERVQELMRLSGRFRLEKIDRDIRWKASKRQRRSAPRRRRKSWR